MQNQGIGDTRNEHTHSNKHFSRREMIHIITCISTRTLQIRRNEQQHQNSRDSKGWDTPGFGKGTIGHPRCANVARSSYCRPSHPVGEK